MTPNQLRGLSVATTSKNSHMHILQLFTPRFTVFLLYMFSLHTVYMYMHTKYNECLKLDYGITNYKGTWSARVKLNAFCWHNGVMMPNWDEQRTIQKGWYDFIL